MELLNRIHGDSVAPEKIASLMHLIKEDRGYQLHQSVQAVKYELSNRIRLSSVSQMEQLSSGEG